MKMFLIIYCEAADEDVIAALKEAGIHGYTKMVEARGEGTETEPKLGTHCWPGKNNVMLMRKIQVDMMILLSLIFFV